MQVQDLGGLGVWSWLDHLSAGEAAEFAERSPAPGPEAIRAHVYSDEFRGGVDRRDAWR